MELEKDRVRHNGERYTGYDWLWSCNCRPKSLRIEKEDNQE